MHVIMNRYTHLGTKYTTRALCEYISLQKPNRPTIVYECNDKDPLKILDPELVVDHS